jgi:hypothetical protein
MLLIITIYLLVFTGNYRQIYCLNIHRTYSDQAHLSSARIVAYIFEEIIYAVEKKPKKQKKKLGIAKT